MFWTLEDLDLRDLKAGGGVGGGVKSAGLVIRKQEALINETENF